MPRLTKEQRREVCAIAAVGCDREIAARYLGCSPTELRAELDRSPRFAKELNQAEAGAELVHMKNLKLAAQEEKNWRASVWWLERRRPDRYGRRDPRAVPPDQVQQFVEKIAAIIAEEIGSTEERARLLRRLEELACKAIGDEAIGGYAIGADDAPDAETEDEEQL